MLATIDNRPCVGHDEISNFSNIENFLSRCGSSDRPGFRHSSPFFIPFAPPLWISPS